MAYLFERTKDSKLSREAMTMSILYEIKTIGRGDSRTVTK